RFDKKPLMTTYRVNHTTPFEMAKMICETLFRLPFEGSTAQLGGGRAKLNANLTTKSSKDSAPDGALGGGSVACVYSSAITTGNISSYSTKPSMILYVQPELGTLTLIGGSEHQIQLVNEFILDNDRKQPQALLEISIITLSEEGSKEFNNTWLMANKNIGLSFSGKNGLGGAYSWHGSKVSTVSNSASMTLQQQISYLISNSKGRILANPKVFVTNGKTTTIDLTQDYIKSTTVQILTSGSGAEGSNASVQRTFETGDDNGIKIEVTPFISPDGYVSLDITPEYASTLRDVMDEYSGYEYTATTLLQRHNLELKSLRIKDEETLLIGGIIQEEEKENVSKVPILGDIPVVGFFFKNQTKKLIKNELLFMITPRIIKDTEDVAEL
ncbi:type II and III secretion system protein, partial [bacterium]|nr:type II and III secretion system protein [bacterium]